MQTLLLQDTFWSCPPALVPSWGPTCTLPHRRCSTNSGLQRPVQNTAWVWLHSNWGVTKPAPNPLPRFVLKRKISFYLVETVIIFYLCCSSQIKLLIYRIWNLEVIDLNKIKMWHWLRHCYCLDLKMSLGKQSSNLQRWKDWIVRSITSWVN